MFDMLKVGRNIVRLRGAAGLTQMGLADKLGISYQAVSNWERGTSMPDISKLPQLAEIFGVGIDEILGEGKSSRIIGSVLEHSTGDYFRQNEVSAQELSEIAPLLQTKQIGEAFEHVKEQGINAAGLLSLAPFLSEETLDKCAKQLFAKEGSAAILPLAPFLSEEALDDLAERVLVKEGIGALVSLAPYVSEEALDEQAEAVFKQEGAGAILSLAPYLSEEALDELAEIVFKQEGSGALLPLAPFLSEEALGDLAELIFKKEGPAALLPLAPFLSEEILDEWVSQAFDK